MLKLSTLFQGWKESDLQTLASACQTKDLSAGESLFVQGEEAFSFFIVGSGTLVIRKMTSGDDESVSSLGAGSVIGEMAMLVAAGAPPDKRFAGAEAKEFSTVVEIPLEAFDKILADHPNLGMLFYKNLGITMAARIRRTTEDFAGLKSLRLRHV